MKANAPEKVYLLFNHPYLVDYAKLNKRRCEEEVEYVRTDAFIEKAAKWINQHTSLSEKLVIENFRKYMEGE